MEQTGKYHEYRSIFERYGKKGFLKVKPATMVLGKILFEFVPRDANGSVVKDGVIQIYLDTTYALTLCKLIDNNIVYHISKGTVNDLIDDIRGGRNDNKEYKDIRYRSDNAKDSLFTPLGGKQTNNGCISRYMQFHKGMGSPLCITALQYPATLKEDGGKKLYVPNFKEGGKSIHIPFEIMELYELSEAIKKAISLYDMHGLRAFEIVSEESSEDNNSESYEESNPTSTITKDEEREIPSPVRNNNPEPSSVPTEEEEELPSMNFSSSEEDEEEIEDFNSFVKTVESSKEKVLTLIVGNIQPLQGGGIKLSTKYAEDGKEAKDLIVKDAPSEGTPLYNMLTYLTTHASCKTNIKVKEENDKFMFVEMCGVQ